MLLSLQEFIGRFHPVLVHLPIGILLIACFFQWLTLKSRFLVLQPAITVLLFWGMLSAVASCVSGYLLAQSGDYDEQLVGRHQWMGIFTAILSLILYVLQRFYVSGPIARSISLVLIVLVIITGHLGGSLTHGSGFLTEGLNSTTEKGGSVLKPIPNVQEANLYADVVQPLLQARCYSCHGPNKQKGKLRLDEQTFIMKGGEEGKVIIPGKADESEIIQRLLLPMDDDDHMPPKEKPQLTETEVALLHWWVSNNAEFNKKIKELPQTDKIKPILASLQSGSSTQEKKTPDIPEQAVEKADDALLNRIRKAGVILIPVAQNSNYLSASFFTATAGADSLLTILEPLKKQLVWLKLDNAVISDSSLAAIAKLSSLTRLQLSNTAITDKGLGKLTNLQQLQSLNLVGTRVTAKGLAALQSIQSLKHLYLYHTDVTSQDWDDLKKRFPTVQIDSGKYTVPTLVTDTTLIKF